jgi:polysaccharide export outer membrane protein
LKSGNLPLLKWLLPQLLAALVLTSIAVTQDVSSIEPQRTDQNSLKVPPVQKERITNAETNDPRSLEEERIRREREKDNERSAAADPGHRAKSDVDSLPKPKEELTEFQKFMFASSGELLPLFGHDLFRGVPTTFAPLDRVPVPSDYIIGPGDELVLRGWGQLDIDYHAAVDRSGNLYVPKVGNIQVAGLRFGELQPYIKLRIEHFFKNFELSVTLGQLRSIQILIVGQAQRPGSYTVSSLSTMVNALFAAGGPSVRGSLRSIQLRRQDRVVTTLDMYALLVHGDKSKDAQLLPGDVLFIPSVGDQVAVSGSVQMPAIYEIAAGETLQDLLEIAGGLTPTASGQKLTIERIDNRTSRSVTEMSLSEGTLRTVLKAGDFVTVRSVNAMFQNAVTLRGNVAVPGRLPWHPGMTVADLIPNRDALVTRDYWLRQSRAFERITDDYAILPKIERDGRDPTALPDSKKETQKSEERLRNEINRLSPEINWDYAVIQRFNREQLTSQLLPFNLGMALGDKADPNNLELRPGDVVTVFSKDDLAVPIAKQPKFVRLEGEFRTAGVYQAKPGETLKQLIERVGGLTESAYLYGAEFTRESTRLTQEKRFQEFLDRFERDVERSSSNRAQNVINIEEAAGLKEKADSERNLIQKLRNIKPTGRIVLGFQPWNTGLDTLPDFELEDGDRLVVPYKPATVNVIGSVFNENSFFHEQGRGVSHYLKLAGGGTRDADRSHAFLVRADGSVVGRRGAGGWFVGGFESTKVMPGDTIVIPEKLERTSILKGLKDWSQVIAQFALGAAAVRTLTSN